MIYLIGGAPRVGKSILAKKYALLKKCSVISTDDLVVASKEVLSKEECDERFPFQGLSANPAENTCTPTEWTALQIISTTSLSSEIDRLILISIEKQESCIIEGVHFLPQHVSSLISQHGGENVKALFLGSENQQLVAEGIKKNTNPDNWMRTSNPLVIQQLASYVAAYSQFIREQASQYQLTYVERTDDFDQDLLKLLNLL